MRGTDRGCGTTSFETVVLTYTRMVLPAAREWFLPRGSPPSGVDEIFCTEAVYWPGNMLRTPDGRLAILDFGLMTQVRRDLAATET
eukprot:1487410-Rhodomonas_salina.2